MNWSDIENALERAKQELEERFPGQVIEVVSGFDIAWVGWEGDSRGALILRDGVPELVAIDQTIGMKHFEAEVLARLPEYRRLIDETARVLSSLWYRRAERGDLRETPSSPDRDLVQAYRYIGYVESMVGRGKRHVAEALRTAVNEATQFPEEIESRRRMFEDELHRLAPDAIPRDEEAKSESSNRLLEALNAASRVLSPEEIDATIGFFHIEQGRGTDADVMIAEARNLARRARAGQRLKSALEKAAAHLPDVDLGEGTDIEIMEAATRVVEGVDRTARLAAYWTASEDLADAVVVQNGETNSARFVTVHGIATAWYDRNLTTAQARALLELDADDETMEDIARNCGIGEFASSVPSPK